MHGQATNKTNYFDKKEKWAWFQRPSHLLVPFLDRFKIELKGWALFSYKRFCVMRWWF